MKLEDYQKRYSDVKFVVEATNFERHTLWSQHQDELTLENDGYLITVGTIDKRPICISVSCGSMFGKRIMFWEATSHLVDHVMITGWLARVLPDITPRQRIDANNFHNCVQALKPK